MATVPRSHLVRFAQLAALWAFSVSQPVFSFLEGNNEFLVLRDSTSAELVLFAVLLGFAPPLVATGYSFAASFVSRWVGDMVFLAALVAFFVPSAFQLVKPLEPGRAPALLLVAALCGIALVGYLRLRAIRLFVTASVVLPVVGFAWFVHGIPVTVDRAVAASAAVHSPHPVVVVVLDELPVTSLMTRTGDIDRIRYPNFGRLASRATWYANATTVHESTTNAVPAILTGDMPRKGTLPTSHEFPHNLFSLLAATHTLYVHETVTRLCSRSICQRPAETLLGRLDELVADVRAPYILKVLPRSITEVAPDAIAADRRFARATEATVPEFERFLAEISSDEPPESLHFAHVLLPHHPWRFLPSGHRYGFASWADWEEDDDILLHTPWQATETLQRHLLQLRYTDSLLGRLLDRLERAGLYDRALVVVVADHGASFQRGLAMRRVERGNLARIARVPLFVKYPGQAKGVVDPRAARTIDILPTIADVLGAHLPWPVDGSSLRGRPQSRGEVVVAKDWEPPVRGSLALVDRQLAAVLRRNASEFGTGNDSLFRIGTHLELLGKPIGAAWPTSHTTTALIQGSSELAHVRKASAFVPAHVSGAIANGRIGEETELAIVVNERVRALTRCFPDGDRQRFSAILPESALRDGFNRVEVYAIRGGGGALRFVRLGSSS